MLFWPVITKYTSGGIADKLQKYFTRNSVALNQEISIFWTYDKNDVAGAPLADVVVTLSFNAKMDLADFGV